MPRWTVHLEGGPRRVNHAAVSIGELIYSFGGYCTGEDYETTRPIDIHILDTRCYRWKALPVPAESDPDFHAVPYQRYGHTSVVYGDFAYIWGGRNDDKGASNVLHCFDTTRRRWMIIEATGNVPGARDGHSACVIQNKMYIFGGYEEWLDRFSNDIHEFSFNTCAWSLLVTSGTPARWRDFQSATSIGHTMYIFGGRGDRAGPFHTSHEVYCNRLLAFDTQSYTWYDPAPGGMIPAGRRSHSAFNYKNELYLFGGYNGIQDVHFSDIYKYSPASNSWSLVKAHGDSPCPRRRQCCSVIGDRVFLFGGTSPCTAVMEGTEFNLMDHSDLFVLDFAPSLKTLCLLRVHQINLDTQGLPRDVKHELILMTTNNSISRPLGYSG